MKSEKQQTAQERSRAQRNDPAGDVDPDRPFQDTHSPDDPEDVGNLDAAYEGREHGEGNYQASKDYGKRVRSFVRSGQVEQAAKDAEPRDSAEARSLTEAEKQGRSRSKGEDAPAAVGKKTSGTSRD